MKRARHVQGAIIMELSQILSWLGTATGMFTSIPQLFKTIRTKKVEDLSSMTFILIVITCTFFLMRMIVIKETAMIVYYCLVVLINLLQLILIWKYKKGIKTV
jgi:uncharacterized protein with PQ loop repeat